MTDPVNNTDNVETSDKKSEKIEQPSGEIKLTSDGGVSKTIFIKHLPGNSAQPDDGMEVSVHYVGTLTNGTEFDSSVKRNTPFKFILGEGSVIKGWDIGVKTMKKGEKSFLFCSPEYAYGENGSGENIPPNSTLRFEIELLDFDYPSITDDGTVRKGIVLKGEGTSKPKYGAICKIKLRGKVVDGDEFMATTDLDITPDDDLEPLGLVVALKTMLLYEKSHICINPGEYHYRLGEEPYGIQQSTRIAFEIELCSFENKKETFLMNNEEKLSEATVSREKGNMLFRKNRLIQAAKRYEYAISCLEDLPGIDIKSTPPNMPGGMPGGMPMMPGMPGGMSMPDMNNKKVKLESEMTADEKEKYNKTKSLTIACLNNLNTINAKKKKHSEIINNSEKILKLDENNVKAFYRKAMALAGLGQFDNALSDMTKASEIDKDNELFRKKCVVIKKLKILSEQKVDSMYKRMSEGFGEK